MKNKTIAVSLIVNSLLLSLILLGMVTYVDNAGIGSSVIQPQVISATPTAPYSCTLAHRGRLVYVDDTNDTTEAYLCFCGVDADDTNYVWLKVQDPSVNCF